MFLRLRLPFFYFLLAELEQHRKWEEAASFFWIVALGNRKGGATTHIPRYVRRATLLAHLRELQCQSAQLRAEVPGSQLGKQRCEGFFDRGPLPLVSLWRGSKSEGYMVQPRYCP